MERQPKYMLITPNMVTEMASRCSGSTKGESKLELNKKLDITDRMVFVMTFKAQAEKASI